MRIIVDAVGGDRGPSEVVKGSIQAINEYDISVVLVGNDKVLKEELAKNNFHDDRIQIIHADEMITNDDSPSMAIRRKKNSSIVIGLNSLNNGEGDAFISAGNTGALLAGGLFLVKRLEKIERAAISTVYPTKKGMSLLIDAGANVDCKPQFLEQFAIMGSIYAENVLGIKSPRVGIVNVGTETEKGNLLVKEAYPLLERANINFVGNVEAREIPEGVVDVMVCDGFVGNVILKLTEGLGQTIFSTLKEEFTSSFSSKLGALMLKPQLKSFKNRFDYREYGGAPLLGIKKPVIKAHGSSDALAFKNAIKQGKIFVEKEVIKAIERDINNSEN